MKVVSIPFVAAVVVVGGIHQPQAWSAPDAGAKARGEFGFYNHSAHGSLTNSRSHVETYQHYLREAHGVAVPAHRDDRPTLPATPVTAERTPGPRPTAAVAGATAVRSSATDAVDPIIAREASDAIADDIERIQRHVIRMRDRARDSGDTEALAGLAKVDTQLGIARRAHAALHEHHAGEPIVPATAMQLAQNVNDALRAAHAEHDWLMQRLHEADAGR